MLRTKLARGKGPTLRVVMLARSYDASQSFLRVIPAIKTPTAGCLHPTSTYNTISKIDRQDRSIDRYTRMPTYLLLLLLADLYWNIEYLSPCWDHLGHTSHTHITRCWHFAARSSSSSSSSSVSRLFGLLNHTGGWWWQLLRLPLHLSHGGRQRERERERERQG
jgi:hypothetical protein